VPSVRPQLTAHPPRGPQRPRQPDMRRRQRPRLAKLLADFLLLRVVDTPRRHSRRDMETQVPSAATRVE